MIEQLLAWKDNDHLVVGETSFRVFTSVERIPRGIHEGTRAGLDEGEFFIFKPRTLLERHAGLIEELQPRHVFELGIFDGGSTLFLAELARPRRIVAIDQRPLDDSLERLRIHAAERGLAEVVRAYGEVDQADRPRLAEIVEEAFGGGGAIDLVIDDCSHMYEETKASFNELFPRLRPGGAYVIEDWRWAHTVVGEEPLEGMFPDRVPLTRLLFEIALAVPGAPEVVREISIEHQLIVVRRGHAEVDPATFDISGCSNPRGRALLARLDAG